MIRVFEDNSVYEEVSLLKRKRVRKRVRQITVDRAEELELAMGFNACHEHIEMIGGVPHRLANSDDRKLVANRGALVHYRDKFWVPVEEE